MTKKQKTRWNVEKIDYDFDTMTTEEKARFIPKKTKKRNNFRDKPRPKKGATK